MASSRVERAREAFELMDTGGDGELSRVEVIRAFRMDEKVRAWVISRDLP